MRDFLRRIGIFFVLLGAVQLALFFASDAQRQPALGYLFWGTIFFFGGAFLAWRSKKPPQKAERFRLMRKLFGSSNRKEEGKVEPGDKEGKDNDE